MNPEFHRRESRPRASAGEWIQAALLAVTLGWTIFGLGGYPAHVMAVSLALTLVLGAVHGVVLGLTWRRGRRDGAGGLALFHRGTWGIWLFVVYAAANVIWITPVPWLGWIDWAKWLQIAIVFAVASHGFRPPGPRRFVFVALALMAVSGVVLACYQRFVNPTWLMLGHVQAAQFLSRSSGPFGAPNSFAGLLLLLVPATAALAARRSASAVERVGWGWVTAVLGLGLVLTFSRGAWLAIAAAVIAAPLLVRTAGWGRRLRLVARASVAVLAVGSAVYVASPQARERFDRLAQDQGERSRPVLWRAAWKLFHANPVFGTGAGSFETGFELYRPAEFVDRPEWAHNDYLNTLSDYGLTGMGLLGVAVALALRSRWSAAGSGKSRGTPDWTESSPFRAGLGLGLLAFALQLMVDFHLKLPALGLAFATIAGLALSRNSNDQPTSAGVGGGVAVLLLVGLTTAGTVVIGFGLSRMFVAEGWREEARVRMDRLGRAEVVSLSEAEELEAQLRQASTYAPRNGAIWSDLADVIGLQATVAVERREALGRAAEQAADRALGCSSHVAEFWLQRGLARSLQNRWVDAGDDFVGAIARAPMSARTWFYYAEHLGRDPTRSALATGAVAFCLRLDPNHREAISLRQRLAASATVP